MHARIQSITNLGDVVFWFDFNELPETHVGKYIYNCQTQMETFHFVCLRRNLKIWQLHHRQIYILKKAFWERAHRVFAASIMRWELIKRRGQLDEYWVHRRGLIPSSESCYAPQWNMHEDYPWWDAQILYENWVQLFSYILYSNNNI